MKKLLNWLLGKKEHPSKKHPKHVGCNFGQSQFNKGKRSYKFVEELNLRSKSKGKPSKTTTTTSTTTKQPVYSTAVILLDFNGYLVTGTAWNYNGDIDCAYSGLSYDEQQTIIDSITEDYAAYNVIVTTDEALYYAASPNRRIRCILTETSEWYGNAGGVAFVNSFTWTDDTPCFVFTALLGYNNKFIREAASHEIGHTMSLYHQCTYDSQCVKVSEYNTGGDGEAPIMGVAYYQPIGKWWVGPNPYGCNSIQNDAEILKSVLGLK